MLARRVRGAAFALACLALGLLGAEALARGFVHLTGDVGQQLARRDPLRSLRVPHGEHGYRQRPNVAQTYANGARATSNALGYRGPLVAIEKPVDTRRIVLLGGSATHGFGVDDGETIDAHMRALLGARREGPRFEVVNLALDGYDSYQVFERMRSDGLRFAPDVVIVNSGINDVRNARFPDLANPDPRTLIWSGPMARMRAELARGGPSLWTRIKHHSLAARVPGLLREKLAQRRRAQRPDPTPSPAALDYFETNILRTVELARSIGAAVILSTPPSALATRHAPTDTSTRDYWISDAATTQAYREELAERMRGLAERLRAQGWDVEYLAPELAPELFLDDCHLTSEGNRALAELFVEAVRKLQAVGAIRNGPQRPHAGSGLLPRAS